MAACASKSRTKERAASRAGATCPLAHHVLGAARMNPRSSLGLFALALLTLSTSLLGGCGNVTVGPGDPGGSGGPGGTGGSGGNGGDVCEAFVPPDVLVEPVTVRLVNKTGANLYLGEKTWGCVSSLGFTIEDGNGQPLKPARFACELSCEHLQQGSCACVADCAEPVVTLVAPDGAYEVRWAGTVFETANMPAECFWDTTCVAPCLVESAPPAQTLAFQSSGWNQIDCGESGCPTCTPDASGTCTIPGYAIVDGLEHQASTSWNGEGEITIAFE